MRPLLATLLLVFAALPAATAAAPLRTAVVADTDNPLAFERIHEAGATMVRLNLSWAAVARWQPAHPSDPADPAYDWSRSDRLVKLAAAHGLQAFVTVWDAPAWAEAQEPHPTHQGPIPVRSWRPSPEEFGAFARALTTHYSGSLPGIPRVRYWEIWDEPNLTQYLSPQVDNDVVVSPDIYRGLVNAFAQAAHSVRSDNFVIAGSLSAFSFETEWGRLGIAPMLFMRKLLCMSEGSAPKPTCAKAVDFDAWSHHPWTSGGPTHKATEKDDVSLGDLPKMERLLHAAYRAGHIRSQRLPQVWVSEFVWDTRPSDPDPAATPIDVQARWVSEALYRAWQQKIGVFTWLTLWDFPYESSSFQGGLFFRNGEDLRYAQPKPTFDSFRFPFVAYPAAKKKIFVWGRTPNGRPARVIVQQRGASAWRSIGSFKTGSDGIFTGKVRRSAVASAAKSAIRRVPAAERYRDAVVSASPLSYWRLDETHGPTAADVMGRSNGQFVGDVRFGRHGAVPGLAAAFDGTTAAVRLGQIPNVHSVELWVKTTSIQPRAAFSNRNTTHAYLFFGTSGGLTFSFDDYPIRTYSVGNGQWHQIVYSYDTATSTGKVYVDGRLGSFAVYPRREGGAPASIAYDASLNSYFRGQIDDVSVYSYPLTAAQVRSHYLSSGRQLPQAVAPGMIRAVDVGTSVTSLPFSLKRVPDRFVQPFGGGAP